MRTSFQLHGEAGTCEAVLVFQRIQRGEERWLMLNG